MDGDSPLEAGLRVPLPAALEAHAGGALFVCGWALAGQAPLAGLTVTVDGLPTPALAERMPSPRVAGELGRGGAEASHCLFWAVATLPACRAGAVVEVGLRARAGAATLETALERIEVAEPRHPESRDPQPEVAICMATHEPPPGLLARQLASLREQTFEDWVCLISDDASGEQRFAELERLTGDDPRFVISRSRRRLGSYANFGRALAMVPPETRYVALSDQDDRWHPEKLERLRAAIGSARLAFSDMRIVSETGEVLSPTYWTARQPNHERFASLLLGNTVTGAASLFRRDLLDDALPLPPPAGNLYHDHWLALVARATGEIAYVPRPLHDYVQHGNAVVGHAGANRGVVGGSVLRRLLALRGREPGRLRGSWRGIYFGEYIRMRLTARALAARLDGRIGASQQRALRLAESGARAVPWLAARQLRRLWRDETQGSEAAMLRALAWQAAMRAKRGREGPADDAEPPSRPAPDPPPGESPPG